MGARVLVGSREEFVCVKGVISFECFMKIFYKFREKLRVGFGEVGRSST